MDDRRMAGWENADAGDIKATNKQKKTDPQAVKTHVTDSDDATDGEMNLDTLDRVRRYVSPHLPIGLLKFQQTPLTKLVIKYRPIPPMEKFLNLTMMR